MIKWFIDQSRSDVGIRLVKLVRVGCWKKTGDMSRAFTGHVADPDYILSVPHPTVDNPSFTALHIGWRYVLRALKSEPVRSKSPNPAIKLTATAKQRARIVADHDPPGSELFCQIRDYIIINNSEKFSKKIVKIKDFWSCKLWPKLFLLTF